MSISANKRVLCLKYFSSIKTLMKRSHKQKKHNYGNITNRYNALPFIKLAEIEAVQIVKSNFLILDLHHPSINIQGIFPNHHARIYASTRLDYLNNCQKSKKNLLQKLCKWDNPAMNNYTPLAKKNDEHHQQGVPAGFWQSLHLSHDQ